jgi:uncharacterized membrane protein
LLFLLWILVLITLAVALGARNRAAGLEYEQRQVERELEKLREQLQQLQQSDRPRERAQAIPPPEAVARWRAETKAPVTTETADKAPSTPPPVVPPAVPSIVPPPVPPQSAPSWNVPRLPIDWEDVVGVKLFSAVAGIALVLAAVFFLSYSIDRGWLGPEVRVALGILIAVALLVVCELKAARKYPVTANALDAAAVAILFATFYAAYIRWNLIPAGVTFGLLVLVTALAVGLSVRRDSRFIAVLGLLGGFATPALLSTGENRPIPLFGYLLVLNAGLAWIAFKKGWSFLSVLTLVFTAVYQWGWVLQYLDAAQLPLGMGIFLVFGIMSFVALILGRRGAGRDPSDRLAGVALERIGVAATLMPLLFALFTAAVPALAVDPQLLFAFVFIINTGLLAVAVLVRDEILHVLGALATLLVLAVWFGSSYSSAAAVSVTLFTVASVGLYVAAPMLADRAGKPFQGVGSLAIYAAPILLGVFAVLARIEPATASPWMLFGTLYLLLALLAWRTLAIPDSKLYFIAAFFALAAQASWSATHLIEERIETAVLLYAVFGVFFLGVPIAARRVGRPLEPRWGAGALVCASLAMLLYLADGPRASAGLWGMAFLLALLNAGLFVESAAGRLPMLSAIGSALSWLVLGVWWVEGVASIGLMPSLLVLVGLTLVMFAGHSWAHAAMARQGDPPATARGFPTTTSLGLVGHGFLLTIIADRQWVEPPWAVLGALLVMTLAASATTVFVRNGVLHAAATIASAVVVSAWIYLSLSQAWALHAVLVTEGVVTYATGWLLIEGRIKDRAASIGALVTLFIAPFALIGAAAQPTSPPLALLVASHLVNLALILWLSWTRQWTWVATVAVAPAWLAAALWQFGHQNAAEWSGVLAFAAALYVMFVAYPFILGQRAQASRDPYLTAIAGSVFFFFQGRSALLQGNLASFVGFIPVLEGAVLALLLRSLLRIEPRGGRDLARLAIVAGSALAFATVAIPLQLKQQWITIGWALEGAALAWLYRRVPHRGLLYWAVALLSAAFVRLALNPSVLIYEPRGMRIVNWYLYAYLIVSVAILLAAWWLSRTDDRLPVLGPAARASALLPAAAVILLFLLLNIEIADFYATGPAITFRFGVTIAQDLTYTVGWLLFGLGLLAAGIYMHSRAGRMTAVALIALTMFKAFLYDMGSLGGLYRVASLVGLAISLSLVAVALQKFVLQAPKERSPSVEPNVG